MTASERKRRPSGSSLSNVGSASPGSSSSSFQDRPPLPLRSAIIQVSIPPEGVRPNFRPRHPAQKFKAIEAYRKEAFTAGRAARAALGFEGLRSPVRAWVLFVFKDSRTRDQDNFTASLKAVWDGLVEARLIPADDSAALRIEPVDMQVGKTAGVMIRLVEAAPNTW